MTLGDGRWGSRPPSSCRGRLSGQRGSMLFVPRRLQFEGERGRCRYLAVGEGNSISQNARITKFDPPRSSAMIAAAEQTPSNFVAQNGSAKSAKAALVRRIARLVRREGLSYD